MNVYTTEKIRNVVLLGHGGAGKTSLVESMAYLAGITTRMGKVDDGNTISDFGKEEQKRKISIYTSVVPIEWEGTKINVLDTPGYLDFTGEVEKIVLKNESSEKKTFKFFSFIFTDCWNYSNSSCFRVYHTYSCFISN